MGMGRQGIEPWTSRLKAECSTSELATREGEGPRMQPLQSHRQKRQKCLKPEGRQ